MKRKAFTLAEVLVTLAIIGVVASLTIPTVVKNHQKQQWISSYKTTFNIVNQATKMVLADNNNSLSGIWGSSNHQQMYQAYVPYLKTAKKCENQALMGNCFSSSSKWLNGSTLTLGGTYSVILVNGASVSFNAGVTGFGSDRMFLDTNGFKGPNVWGKDIHAVWIIVAENQVKPYSFSDPEANILADCPSNLDTSGDGYSCGVRILRGDYAEDY